MFKNKEKPQLPISEIDESRKRIQRGRIAAAVSVVALGAVWADKASASTEPVSQPSAAQELIVSQPSHDLLSPHGGQESAVLDSGQHVTITMPAKTPEGR